MTDYTKTEHLGLDLYGDSDPADLRDGHNNNMRVIDNELGTQRDDVNGLLQEIKTKADTTDVTDGLALKANSADVTDGLALKANSADVYTKTDSDSKYGNKIIQNLGSLGIKLDGSEDVADAIQEIIYNSPNGIYFPSGIYKISKPLNFPYNTTYPYSIDLDNGATIIATAAMDNMFNIGATDNGGDINEMYTIRGGHFIGANLAQCAIHITDKLTGTDISNVSIDGTTTYGIRLEKPVVSNSNDAKISDFRFNYVHRENNSPQATALQFEGGDSIVTNAYICNCKTAIYSWGYIQIDNIHTYNTAATNDLVKTTALDVPVGGLFTNIYIDTTQVGLTTEKKSPNVNLCNFFFMGNGAITQNSDVIQCGDATVLAITNLRVNKGPLQSSVKVIRAYTKTGAESLRMYYFSLSGFYASYKDDTDPTDLIFSGANQVPISRTVNDNVSVTPNLGVLIGYVPKPSANGQVSAQSFTIHAANGFFAYDAFNCAVVNDNGNVLNRLLGTHSYEKHQLGGATLQPVHCAIGLEKTVDGLPVYPLYAYAKINYNWHSLIITPTSANNSGFIFPALLGKETLALTNENTLATTEDDGNIAPAA